MVDPVRDRLGKGRNESVQHLFDEGRDALVPLARDLLDLILEASAAADVPLLIPARVSAGDKIPQ